MKKIILTTLSIIVLGVGIVYSAPSASIQYVGTMLPVTGDAKLDIGTSTNRFRNLYISGSVVGGTITPSGLGTNMLVGTNGSGSLTSTSSPTVGYLTATSTTATSTLQKTSITGAVSILGEYFTNFTTYVRSLFSSGTGISISGGQITNTAPDQTVVLNNGTAISVTGTYPNFTITNTSPSSGGTVTGVTATYPILSSQGTAPVISTAFGTSTTIGVGLNQLLSVNASGVIVASSTIGNNQLQNNSITVTTASPLGGAGTISLGGTLALTCTGCLTSLSGAASSTLLVDNNTWSGINTFNGKTNMGYASTTQIGSTGSAYFATGGGNVGIGTTGPLNKLQIGANGGAGGTIVMQNEVAPGYTAAYTATDSGFLFGTQQDSANGYVRSFDIGIESQASWINGGGQLRFWTTPNSGGDSVMVPPLQRMVIDKNGNVGIGTTSPSSLLSVQGNSYVSGSSFFGGAITGTSTLAIQGTGNSYILGNVGIGTTSPYAKLSVGGDVVIGASTAGGTLGDLYLPKLGTAAGTFIAADATGKLIATTTPSGGAGLTSLNGQTGAIQTFATSSSASTNFTITSTGNVHTLNIPPASDTANGLVTTGTQTFAGAKTFGSSLTVSSNITSTNGSYTGSGYIYTSGNADSGISANIKNSSWVDAKLGLNNGNSGLGANYSGSGMFINPRFQEYSSGNHPLISSAIIKPILIDANTATVSDTASLYIEGAATTTVVSGKNYSLWVDDVGGGGTSLIDGTVLLSTTNGSVGIGSTTPNATLSVNGSGYFSGSLFVGGAITATSTLTLSDIGKNMILTSDANGMLVSSSTPTAAYYLATSSIASQFPYASSTAVTISGQANIGSLAGSIVSSLTANYLPKWNSGTWLNSLLIDNGTNVGIGTTSPWGRLSVTGTDTTAGSKAFVVADSNNVPKMVIQNDGNVGIGTTAPVAADGSSRTLQLLNTVVLQNVVGSQALFSNNAYYDGTWKYVSTATAAAMRMGAIAAGDISFHAAASGTAGNTITNWDGSDVRMIIKNTGNVGIGTTNPTSKLHVTSGASATTTVSFGEVGSATSHSCFNTKNTAGGDISFYFVGTSMIIENNLCK